MNALTRLPDMSSTSLQLGGAVAGKKLGRLLTQTYPQVDFQRWVTVIEVHASESTRDLSPRAPRAASLPRPSYHERLAELAAATRAVRASLTPEERAAWSDPEYVTSLAEDDDSDDI